MLPFKLLYSDRYDLHLGAHIFPSQKYRLIKETLLAEYLAEPADFLEPDPARDEDVLLAHSQEWVRKLTTGKMSVVERMRMEIPWSKEMVEACWMAAGGSIMAGRLALREGFAVNIAGGLHHAHREHGEGFCAINDIAVAVRRLQVDKAVETAMVVDTDVHHGNGTAHIFGGDPSVFTLSIHQENNYPMPKPPSDLDIHLPDHTGDDDYLARLGKGLMQAFEHSNPGVLFHVSGADPYKEDQLGGLSLTIEGLQKRDRLVYDYARRHGVPAAITLAGGYARDVNDTIRIHVNTILAARDAAQLKNASSAR